MRFYMTGRAIMAEIAGEELKSYAMDHHGLVAAVSRDLDVAGKINARLDRKDPRRIVSAGTAVSAMILNGLGFTNRRLYLTPQFFGSKPVDRLLGENISAENLDDHVLGKALDEISEYGASRLFGEVAFEIALENNLLDSPLAHLDSTSLSVEGEYEEENEEGVIKISYGHSKDHRPDLKQAVMSLVVSGSGGIPIWMEPQDGNSSDKKAFHETIKKVREFQKQLKGCPDFKWVADSALYSEDKLLRHSDYLWISRVPETIKEAKKLSETGEEAIDWKECEKGYKIAPFQSEYGGVKQRWLLVYSQKAYEREKKTFDRKLEKQEKELTKLLWHLSHEEFSCQWDGDKALDTIVKKYSYHEVARKLTRLMKHEKRGRPKSGDVGIAEGYKIEGQIKRNESEIEKFLNRKGRFILATNDLDENNFPDETILFQYKEQQKVERGFRFLKDPWFMVDSVFLKSENRIEALMMVMTLCLMIYNVAQHRLRTVLREKNETLPNQLNKPIKNPTMRWIFQIMEGIGVIRFYEKQIRQPIREVITNLSELRLKIIHFFGQSACEIYGII
jgi:transposase